MARNIDDSFVEFRRRQPPAPVPHGLTADPPACPTGFENCGTTQIEGETFLTKYVATGARAGWLYLERDHGDVRAQVILQPYEDGWSLPLEAVAELLLDDRWSTLDPESSVSYPELL